VKDDVTFLVMDDLVIQPLNSAIAMVSLLRNKFNINEIGVLQEMVVELGLDEVSIVTCIFMYFISNF